MDGDEFPDGMRLRSGTWDELHVSCTLVRDEVFVTEQGVPIDLEHDGRDADCLHVVATSADGTPIGAGRLLPDGHIGRLAVRRPWRGHGVGGAMLALLIEEARERGSALVILNAQTTALDFYLGFGFEAIGNVFVEAGLEHQAMQLPLR